MTSAEPTNRQASDVIASGPDQEEKDELKLCNVPNSIDAKAVRECTTKIRSAAIKPLAEAFAENIHSIRCLLALPLDLMIHSGWEQLHLALSAQAMVDTGGDRNYSTSEEARRKVRERTNELFKEAAQKDEQVESILRHAWSGLAHLEKIPDIRLSCGALLNAGAAQAWAAYESVMQDAWIATLNTSPAVLAARAIKSIPQDSGSDISGKNLSVNLAIQQGFDLSRSMGTLLAPKFDFTSAIGIERAYREAFGTIPILTAMRTPELDILESTRHLIVHRAGIVDQDFIRRTKSKLAIGSTLNLDLEQVAVWIKAVSETGRQTLTYVDSFLFNGEQKS